MDMAMSDYGFWVDTSEEVSRDEIEERLDDSLNDGQEWPQVGSLSFAPSDILRELDPIAYRIAVSEYHDMLVSDGEIVENAEELEEV